jgi:hypothetical protein
VTYSRPESLQDRLNRSWKQLSEIKARHYQTHDAKELSYVLDLEAEVDKLRSNGGNGLIGYRILRILALICSAVTPALALMSAPTWLTAAIASIVFVSEGTIQVTRLQERAALDLRMFRMLSAELRLFAIRQQGYAEPPAFERLVERVESIRRSHAATEIDIIKSTFDLSPIQQEGKEKKASDEPG